MYNFKIENPNQYNPTDIVRVTVIIKDGYDKEKVIDEVSKEMKNLNFELHNTKIIPNGFTANIQYSLIEKLEGIEGIETVKLSEKVDMTTPSNNEENNESLEVQPDSFQPDYLMTGCGILVLVIGVALIFKRRKK